MKPLKTHSLMEFQNFVQTQVLPLVAPQTLFLLEGEPGAGKTEIVKNLSKSLNLKDVQSPTFAFHHQYSSSHEKISLHHVDLYRLQSEEDLESTGFWDLFADSKSVIFVEWSQKIQDEAWPWGWNIIKIKIQVGSNPQERLIFMQLPIGGDPALSTTEE